MRFFSNAERPVYLSPFPVERLPRAALSDEVLRVIRDRQTDSRPATANVLASICREYCEIYERFRDGAVAPEKAPYFEEPAARSNELKSMALFFDATLVGVSNIPELVWLGKAIPDHTCAVVLAVEYNDYVEHDNPVHDLIRGSDGAVAKLRATEVATVISGYIRQLGFSAVAHTPHRTDISLAAMAVKSGIARFSGGKVTAPFLGSRFAIGVVTTNMQLAPDLPLGPRRPLEGGAAWWFGVGGTETWWNRWFAKRRPNEWGKYPMETVKRVEETTTLIIDDEIPRLPKRSNGFYRGHKGDFGDKVAREFYRFAIKTPVGMALADLQMAHIPFQNGQISPQMDKRSLNPELNRRALKSLLHHLGADIAGTCEAKRFVWYSHDYKGRPIDIYHKSALVMVIDQGFETMEGASGDDWVSGTQSFRAYIRGGQIAGVTAAYIRSLGHSARSHTNADSDVIQTPLVLLAGLGEMSRIGETVLNPFIGPRSKSAVVTTNIPVAWDKPIDFGLQDACRKCMKCARECPCDAITYGEPVMFNGYEQWKQDVQRCTSYRMTNAGGAACGRCMKTCPYNNEGLLIHRILLWIATKVPATRSYLARLDDGMGYGDINPIKRWWAELEIVAGKVVKPKLVNRRGLDQKKGFLLKDKQKIAYTNADMLPPPNFRAPFPVDRKAGVAAAQVLETPQQARERISKGGPKPTHYNPTPPIPAVTTEVDNKPDSAP